MEQAITLTRDGQRVILHFHTNVTSVNATEMKNTADALLKGQERDVLEADLSGAQYFSSAGLRVLLMLSRGEKRFLVTGVCPEIYDTLSMTGFTDIMDVRRREKQLSLENAVLIGDGFNSKVYRVDDENIVKVFVNDSAEDDIRHELSLAKYALTRGIPTAISYDVVEVEGKKGVLFEMMNCGSLRDAIRDCPEDWDSHVDKYVGLIRELHSTRDSEHRLPNARERELHSLEKLKGFLNEEEFSLAQRLLDTIPESDCILHGDCHVKNIMLHNGDPVLIDLETLSHGDPVIEFANIYYAYTAFEQLWAGNDMSFFQLDADTCFRLRDEVFDRYFDGLSEEDKRQNLDRVRFLSGLRMLAHLMHYHADDERAVRVTKEDMLSAARRCGTLVMKMP